LIIIAHCAYESYGSDKAKANPQNCIVLTGDLQQVMVTPQLWNSSCFYMRKLSNYNFGIHDFGLDPSFMHIWNETIARREAIEIYSCVHDYIHANYSPLDHGQIRELILWTDRCVWKNKNIFALFTLMNLVRQNNFTSFSHKFYMMGHSYIDCDRDYSQIEKKQRTANIIAPADLEKVIRDAKTNNSFEIKWMDLNLLLNFKQLITFFERPATLQGKTFTGLVTMLQHQIKFLSESIVL